MHTYPFIQSDPFGPQRTHSSFVAVANGPINAPHVSDLYCMYLAFASKFKMWWSSYARSYHIAYQFCTPFVDAWYKRTLLAFFIARI